MVWSVLGRLRPLCFRDWQLFVTLNWTLESSIFARNGFVYKSLAVYLVTAAW
jgi:hypothetical protein